MMKEARSNSSCRETLLKSSDPPFIKEVMEVPLPSKFKMPNLERYEGSTDLVVHLDTFKVLMQLQGAPDAIMCRLFIATLKGNARAWYRTLKLGSIKSFSKMEQFARYFISRRRMAKTSAHLLNLVQGERKTFKKFIHRFVAATSEIRNLDHGVVLTALTTTLQPGNFLYSLGKRPLVDMGELMARAQNYINLEEVMDTRRDQVDLKRKSSRDIGEDSKIGKKQESNKQQSSPKGLGHTKHLGKNAHEERLDKNTYEEQLGENAHEERIGKNTHKERLGKNPHVEQLGKNAHIE
ncbi:uncharacterized protein LOC131164458 [Malania oleifera]|uniref:uncharacterized protein LOC131164458 n=1 Tax=Malania oleifera TaxID=397392 RepID=UPI0025AE543D|nr:uncharacterized protein LOC131164458 [Malania oleifera]